MTAPRQKQKRSAIYCAALAGVAMVLSAIAVPARAGLTQRIVVDWHTGLAIGGYDPVAFFIDGKPKVGSGKFELSYGGVIWRFCNSGNRAAFAERPEVYMPQYGGYDPVDIGRDLAVAGNPALWTIVNERLFLFYDAADRSKFLSDSGRFIAAAQRKWPDVMATLNP